MANSKQYILSLFPDNNNNEITAADVRIFVNAIFDEEVDITAIVDNLVSTDGKVPLSANQGRILDAKITQVQDDILTKEDSLGLGSRDQVLSIDLNNNKIWRTLPSVNEVVVYNGLDSVSSVNALSANMGRILDERLTTNTNNIGINLSLINTNIVNIADNRALINTNIDNINTNSNNIADNRALINTNINNINTNSNAIIANTNLINTNIAEIDNNKTLIDANGVSIVSLNDEIVRIDGEITVINGRITVNETDIAALQLLIGNTDLTQLETRVQALELQVQNNTSAIDSNTLAISNNSQAIGNNTQAVSTNSANISTNTTNISTNTTNIFNTTGRVTVLESDLLALDGRVQTNTNNIASNLAKIVTNETELTVINNKINNNSTLISHNSTDIYNNKQDIEILQTNDITHFQEHEANSILIENNRSNIIRVDADLSTLNASLSTLSIEVNGSQDGTIPGKEDNLGVPGTQGYVLSSTTDGQRQWVENAFSAVEFSVVDNLTSVGNDFDALSANQGYVLDNKVATKESYLGVPTLDGMILSGNQDGTRNWVESKVLAIDYGVFFGDGFTLIGLVIQDVNLGVTINNTAENATRQIEAIGTFQDTSLGGTNQTVTVNVTDSVVWKSLNEEAFIVNNGIDGGKITCVTQHPTFVTPGSYIGGNSVQVNATLEYKSVILIASEDIEIDNTPVVNSIRIEPSNTINLNIMDVVQTNAIAGYTHNNWNSTPTTITSSSSTTWTSNDNAVATVQDGLIQTISAGQTFINATNNNKTASVQVIVS